jgi:hypothetical protein
MLEHMNIISLIHRNHWTWLLLSLAYVLGSSHQILAQTASPFPTRISFFEGLSKDELLTIVKSWLGQPYNRYPHQVHPQDGDTYQLKAKCTFYMNNNDVFDIYYIDFTVLITIKDGKIKTDFIAMDHIGKITNGGSLAKYSPSPNTIGPARWTKIRVEGFRNAERYIDHLETYIRNADKASKW